MLMQNIPLINRVANEDDSTQREEHFIPVGSKRIYHRVVMQLSSHDEGSAVYALGGNMGDQSLDSDPPSYSLQATVRQCGDDSVGPGAGAYIL